MPMQLVASNWRAEIELLYLKNACDQYSHRNNT